MRQKLRGRGHLSIATSYLSSAEVERVLDACLADESGWGTLFLLALTTGMREGEVLGLAWRDVNLEAGTLTVRANLKRISAGGYAIGTTKTASSRRTFSLEPATLAALRQHHTRQKEQHLRRGARWQYTDLVFTSDIGTRLHPGNMRTRRYYPFLRAWGLPQVSFHALRHSYATFLLSKGVDLKTVSARLGHADTAITTKFYAHVTPEMDARATAVWAPTVLRVSGTKTQQGIQGAEGA